MNHKIIVTLAAANIFAAFGVVSSDKYMKPKNDNVKLENIEALTVDEVGKSYTCYNTITTKEGSMVRYCQSCTYVEGTDSWVSSKGHCTYRQ